MRCLQCGSQLALLKKLTDGEFCSADHRTLFYDTQQKLIIERLAESARKLKRYKLVSKAQDPAVTPSAPAVEPLPAAKPEESFPPFAEHIPVSVLNTLTIRNYPYGIASGFAPAEADLVLIPPVFTRVQGRQQAPLAGLLPTFLAAKAGSRRKHIEIKVDAASAAPIFPQLPDSRISRSPGMRTTATFRGDFDNPIAAVHAGPDPLRGSRESGGGVQTSGRLMRLKAPGPSSSQPVSHSGERAATEPAAHVATPAIPDFGDHRLQFNGLDALSKPFGMRPRGPLPDDSLAQFHPIEANSAEARSAESCVIPAYPSPDTNLNGPASFGRFFRVRPRSGVESSTLLELEQIEPSHGPTSISAASIPSLGAVGSPELVLPVLSRFFNMRPRGPVQDPVLSGSESIGSAVFESYIPSPSLPVYTQSAAGNFAPLFLDRGFRARPRGPVQPEGLVQFESIVVGGPASLASPPVLARLAPTAIGDCFPRGVRRFYRLGPKVPIIFEALSSFESIADSRYHSHVPAPVLAGLPARILGELSPLQVERFFGVRPCGPVQAAALSGSEQIPLGSAADLMSAPVTGTLPAYIIGECAPDFLVRFFRARARGPVESRTLLDHEEIETGIAADLASAPATVAAPAYVIGECAPSAVVRFFRVRPHGPSKAAALAAFEHIETGASAELASQPAIGTLPADVIGECAPDALARFFRARPRGPVEPGTPAAFERIGTGTSAELASGPAIGALPLYVIGECTPNALERFFRVRPRGPVDATAISSYEDIASGLPAVLVSKPAPGTLPSKVIGECAPVLLVRFFRARPRGPVEAALPAMELIGAGPAADLISKPVIGGMPAKVLGECAPDPVIRFLRSRPRGPVNGEVIALMRDGLTCLDAKADLAIAALPRIAPADPQPVFSERPFRMKPRAASADRNLRSFDVIHAGYPARLHSLPVLAVLPVGIIGGVKPVLLDKPYKMRPRGPVQAIQLAAFEQIAAGEPAMLPVKGVMPLIESPEGSEFAPAFLDRFYRMRPRGPVQPEALRFEIVMAGEPEVLTPCAAMPSMPAVLMRQARMPSKDRGPRMRPPGPRSSSGTPGFDRLDEGEPEETRVPQASMIALPDGISGDCMPRTSTRLFRMRPRGASADGAVARFERIASGSAFSPVASTHVRAVQGELAIGGALPASNCAAASGNFTTPDKSGVVLHTPSGSQPVLPSWWAAKTDAQPEAASTLLPVMGARQFTPLKHASLAPVVVPITYVCATVRPVFAADPIVDYRPSLIDIRQAFRESHQPRWLGRIAEFWNETTWDLKWATAAVPVLLGIVIHYALAKPPAATPMANVDTAAITANPLPPIKTAVAASWPGIRQELAGRAAVELQDDFTTGLNSWSGDADWSKSWKYDTHGGVKPGALALYTPTVGMSDYQVEFTGEIEKKSLGWVFRAADTRNYYSVKLTTLKPGPMPTVAIVRSAVINGKEGPRTQTLLPFPVSRSQTYRVRMEVNGQSFTVFVQDHVVAFWSDGRLKTGGIGFFSGNGEQARVESVRVTHQQDALGQALRFSLAKQDKISKQSGVSTNESEK